MYGSLLHAVSDHIPPYPQTHIPRSRVPSNSLAQYAGTWLVFLGLEGCDNQGRRSDSLMTLFFTSPRSQTLTLISADRLFVSSVLILCSGRFTVVISPRRGRNFMAYFDVAPRSSRRLRRGAARPVRCSWADVLPVVRKIYNTNDESSLS